MDNQCGGGGPAAADLSAHRASNTIRVNAHAYTPQQFRHALLRLWSEQGVAEKAGKIDEVLHRYKGKEACMVQTLERKYKVSFPAPSSPVPSTSSVDVGDSQAASSSSSSSATADSCEGASFFQTIVIGSGPHALALVMRLLDDEPDTCGNFWIGLGSRPTGHRETIDQLAAEPGHRCRNAKRMGIHRQILVVDPSGRWMTQWDQQFAALEIPFLRSAFDAHPAAFQSQALKAFAEAQGRDEEFHQLEEKRYPGYDGPFRAPGSFLFMDYCAHLVKMYQLEDCVMKDTVLDVTQYNSTVDESASVPDTSSASPLLTVSMASGRKLVARVVVAAMGPTTVPRIPSWAQGLETECSSKGDSGYRRIRHAWDLIRGSAATGVRTSEDQAAVVDPSSASDPGRSAGKVSAKSKALARKARRKRTLADNRAGTRLKRRQANCQCDWDSTIKDSRVLIVGGGLTSVHLLTRAMLPLLKARESLPPEATLASARAIVNEDPTANVPAQVMLVSRHELVVKQFDLNIEWVSWAERPKRLGQFYKTSDMKERRAMLVDARGGGSITPHSNAMLKRLRSELGGDHSYEEEEDEDAQPRRCSLGGEEPAVIVQENVEVEGAMWIGAEDSSGGKPCWEVYFDDGERREFDQIWLATGAVLDVEQDPVLGSVMKQWPIATERGLPVLQPSLRWRRDCPLYVMGPYAQLQLGPDALNLAGSRSGSCRIDTAIRPMIRGGADDATEIESIGVKLTNSGWCSVNLKFCGEASGQADNGTDHAPSP